MVRGRFGAGEVDLVAVSYAEPAQAITSFVEKTGLTGQVLMDDPDTPTQCHGVAGGGSSAYEHFADRVGDPNDGPYPLQLVIDPEGRFRYLSRTHQPEQVLQALDEILAEPR